MGTVILLAVQTAPPSTCILPLPAVSLQSEMPAIAFKTVYKTLETLLTGIDKFLNSVVSQYIYISGHLGDYLKQTYNIVSCCSTQRLTIFQQSKPEKI